MMNEHTTKAFDVDLQEITRLAAKMGGLAEKQVADSIDALTRRDGERARRSKRVVRLIPGVLTQSSSPG
jgi:phosphate transport system protein